jgi:hypothetical protein
LCWLHLYCRGLVYRSLAKYCTTWVRIWWEKYLEIAARSWVYLLQMIVPSGILVSKATVCGCVDALFILRGHLFLCQPSGLFSRAQCCNMLTALASICDGSEKPIRQRAGNSSARLATTLLKAISFVAQSSELHRNRAHHELFQIGTILSRPTPSESSRLRAIFSVM